MYIYGMLSVLNHLQGEPPPVLSEVKNPLTIVTSSIKPTMPRCNSTSLWFGGLTAFVLVPIRWGYKVLNGYNQGCIHQTLTQKMAMAIAD